MAEHPILFTGEMVKAILSGRKTQTRRIVKNIHQGWLEREGIEKWCPYGKVGATLWVREAWWAVEVDQIGVQYGVFDDEFVPNELGAKEPEPQKLRLLERQNWRYGRHPSIHMPKSITRIFLEITNIRVERVQDISEEDAVAEGLCPEGVDIGDGKNSDNPIEQFAQLWDSINAKRGYSWDSNSFVWCISFNLNS